MFYRTPVTAAYLLRRAELSDCAIQHVQMIEEVDSCGVGDEDRRALTAARGAHHEPQAIRFGLRPPEAELPIVSFPNPIVVISSM